MIIALVGKTNSFKDGIAKYLFEVYGIPAVCSYTTRPMRDYEIDGVQHLFVDDDKMREILDTEDIVAYTKNEKTGIQYCATLQSFPSNDVVYIINPDGIYWFEEHGTNKTELKSIYVYAEESDILTRGRLRGDNLEVLETRLSSEREEFDSFYNNKEYDYLINNTSTLDYVYSQVDSVMKILGFEKLSR